ncbi:MAG: hypothetical protein AAGJ80_15560 [Cyanobacteria bacterium J06553_1]
MDFSYKKHYQPLWRRGRWPMDAFLIGCALPWEAAPMRSPTELSDWLASAAGIQPQIAANSK